MQGDRRRLYRLEFPSEGVRQVLELHYDVEENRSNLFSTYPKLRGIPGDVHRSGMQRVRINRFRNAELPEDMS
ncbi:hypothetical protein TNIN_13981 [Trichonephila inaurata madagascariensis]|uniref:Uncharacterized protein n=1 Tax=Trichonephila inaurata madagascariensis TaxID=2747483 RepID=A0A8X7BPY0_9ARAC|nr:hypothetical protein TNIN_13981 [Trichonephila inaurata madagascariensis]